jgi:hypothetical protein
MEAAGDTPVEKWRARFDDVVGPPATRRPQLRDLAWPPLVKQLLAATEEPAPLREVLTAMAQGGGTTASEILRALELLLAVKLLAWQ